MMTVKDHLCCAHPPPRLHALIVRREAKKGPACVHSMALWAEAIAHHRQGAVGRSTLLEIDDAWDE